MAHVTCDFWLVTRDLRLNRPGRHPRITRFLPCCWPQGHLPSAHLLPWLVMLVISCDSCKILQRTAVDPLSDVVRFSTQRPMLKEVSRKVCQRATACQKLIDQRSLQTFRKQSCGLLLIVSEGRALACALDFSLACALDLLWAKTWSNTTPPPHPRYECWWICMRASFCDWTSFSCGRVSERPHSGLHVKGR